jgi:hypothetical protein
MSADLGDLKRVKLTEESLAWLEAESRATGKTRQEILRDTMHDHALQQRQKAKVLLALWPREGRERDGEGRER